MWTARPLESRSEFPCTLRASAGWGAALGTGDGVTVGVGAGVGEGAGSLGVGDVAGADDAVGSADGDAVGEALAVSVGLGSGEGVSTRAGAANETPRLAASANAIVAFVTKAVTAKIARIRVGCCPRRFIGFPDPRTALERRYSFWISALSEMPHRPRSVY